MKNESSFTASIAATARGLGEILPEDARLVVDPYGTRFAERWLRFIVRFKRLFAPLIERVLLTMQLRTRVIDDLVAAFIKEGGGQVVLLGAGFDCRALRFKEARFFEVDHPATQARKRSIVDSGATYLTWDFESRSVDELPRALAAIGHDASQPTLTIWEGVSMYLTPESVDATMRAVTAYSASRSVFVFSYITPDALKRGGGLLRRLLKSEPLIFAIDPGSISSWMAERRLSLAADTSIGQLAQVMLPARYHRFLADDSLRFAICRM